MNRSCGSCIGSQYRSHCLEKNDHRPSQCHIHTETKVDLWNKKLSKMKTNLCIKQAIVATILQLLTNSNLRQYAEFLMSIQYSESTSLRGLCNRKVEGQTLAVQFEGRNNWLSRYFSSFETKLVSFPPSLP